MRTQASCRPELVRNEYTTPKAATKGSVLMMTSSTLTVTFKPATCDHNEQR